MSTDTATALGQPAIEGCTPQPDDLRMWSVTTIIGCLDKPALMYWSAEQAAEAAIDNERTWKALLHDQGRDEAVKWLRDARFRKPKGARSATDLGSAIHAACEDYVLTGTRPDVDDEVRPFLDQFDRWLQRYTPEYIATEVCVYTPEYGVAGTADGFFRLAGVPLIFDIKTSRKDRDSRGDPTSPYSEVALQLAAYRHATMAAVWRPRRYERYRRRYYVLSPAEQAMGVPVPEVDGGVCIHITPTRCQAYPVRCDRPVYEAFLYILEAARWLEGLSKNVIGTPLAPPQMEVA